MRRRGLPRYSWATQACCKIPQHHSFPLILLITLPPVLLPLHSTLCLNKYLCGRRVLLEAPLVCCSGTVKGSTNSRLRHTVQRSLWEGGITSTIFSPGHVIILKTNVLFVAQRHPCRSQHPLLPWRHYLKVRDRFLKHMYIRLMRLTTP